jgi:hypothetical protein
MIIWFAFITLASRYFSIIKNKHAKTIPNIQNGYFNALATKRYFDKPKQKHHITDLMDFYKF